jgi:hypothetical protein
MEPKAVRFVHRFANGVRCEVIIPEDPPPKKKVQALRVNWVGRYTQDMFEEYYQWMRVVLQTVASTWGFNLISPGFIRPNRLVFWIREDQSPKSSKEGKYAIEQ